MTIIQRAWLAGIIDGEGHLSYKTYKKSTKSYRKAVLRVRMCSHETCEYIYRITQCGRVKYEDYRKDIIHHSPVWCWEVTRKADILAILHNICKYSITKQSLIMNIIQGLMV